MTATAAQSLELPEGYQSHRCVVPSLHEYVGAAGRLMVLGG